METVLKANFFEGKEILLVDDEKDLREIIASEFEFLGGKIYEAENISKADEIFQSKQLDLIISDIRMPGGSGLEFLASIRKKDSTLPVVLMTGFADITLEKALHQGADVLVGKPFKLDDLLLIAQHLIKPLEEKFNHLPSEAAIFKNLGEVECLALGRGGAALRISSRQPVASSMDLVKFSIKHLNSYFEGYGQCRWIKNDSLEEKGMILGVEFQFLTQDSILHLKNFLHEKNPIPLIPFVY